MIYFCEAWDGNDTGTAVYAAFSTKEKAQEYCDNRNLAEPEYDYSVREMEVDEAYEMLPPAPLKAAAKWPTFAIPPALGKTIKMFRFSLPGTELDK